MNTLKDKHGNPIQSIVIQARRWRDKRYGNTYFTAAVCVNAELVGELPFQYGYERQYEAAAGQWLEDNGYVELDNRPLHVLATELNFHYISEAVDVDRKKDRRAKWGF